MKGKVRSVCIILFLLYLLGGCGEKNEGISWVLECEYLSEPLGVEVGSTVRLSWSLPDVEGIGDDSLYVFLSENQEAVEKREASCLYKKLSPLSVMVACEGVRLQPGITYYWSVGTEKMVSGIASFTTAFLLDGALWISDGKDIHDKSSAIFLLKEFLY